MRLIKSSLAGPVLAGVLAMTPAAAFAHGGGGGGGGGHGGGGGGHGFGGGGGRGFGGGHAFNGHGFSPGFRGTRGFFTGRFSDRGDHDRFGDRGFRGRDRDFRDHRFRDFDGDIFDFGAIGFGYPDYYPYYYPYSYYNYDGYLSVERVVQEELAELGYYSGPVDGTISPETQRAIRWFRSVAKIPVTGRIDSATLRALQIS
jgi:hypothetical protein